MNRVVHDVLKWNYNLIKFDLNGMMIDFGLKDQKSIGRIKEQKGKYKGKKIVLIGSGPSLTIDDLTTLSNCDDVITMACNSIFKAYELTPWRADLYSISDIGVFKTVGKKVLDLQDGKPFFVTEEIYNIMDDEDKEKVYPIRVKTNVGYPQKRKFSNNALRYTYMAGSVLYFMLQIAYYLGCEEIYMLGCDCNYSYTRMSDGSVMKTSDKDYFLPGYEDRKGHQPINQYEIVMPDYEEARRFFDDHGIKAFNATRGGKLESFIRVDFDDVFKEK